jgi:Rab GDP dissociation inhibitor
MDQEYDCIVIGTGLTECIISGLMSVSGKKVLHIDKNGYYGSESASLCLEDLFKKFRNQDTIPKTLGNSREYNVDLIPKFLMANGNLVKLLRATGVTRYNMEFIQLDGTFVMNKKRKIHKVPVTTTEVLGSSLLSLTDKGRMKTFLSAIYNYDPEKNDPKDPFKNKTMKEVYKSYGISEDSIDFLGHAVALEDNDDYVNQPAIPTILKMKLYYDSLMIYNKSPFVYPLYGLGELPQVFARLCAVYGGTFMLNKPVDKFHYDPNGQIVGVESEGEVAKCKFVVAEPSYFPDLCKKVGRVIRVICITEAPIDQTNNSHSCQVIIPQKTVGRKHDIYMACMSYQHKVASKGKYVIIIATRIETEKPELEVKPALDIVEKTGKILEKFVNICDLYEPLNDGKKNNVFLSKSYDASTHFETATDDVLDIYQRITGTKFDLDAEILKRQKEMEEMETRK